MNPRDEFKRAFAAATVHDMFNWLTVILLLIIEKISGYLEFVSDRIVDALLSSESNSAKTPDFLKVLTNPFTKSVIQLDKRVLQGWASNDPSYENVTTVLKTHCVGDCSYVFYGLGPEGPLNVNVNDNLIIITFRF